MPKLGFRLGCAIVIEIQISADVIFSLNQSLYTALYRNILYVYFLVNFLKQVQISDTFSLI